MYNSKKEEGKLFLGVFWHFATSCPHAQFFQFKGNEQNGEGEVVARNAGGRLAALVAEGPSKKKGSVG